MRTLLLPLLAALLWVTPARAADPLRQAQAVPIAPEQAKDHVGQVVTVRGLVAEVHPSKKATFLNFGAGYPHQVFSAVAFASPTFAELAGFEGKTVSVTGTVQLYKGKPEIVLTSAAQVAE